MAIMGTRGGETYARSALSGIEAYEWILAYIDNSILNIDSYKDARDLAEHIKEYVQLKLEEEHVSSTTKTV